MCALLQMGMIFGGAVLGLTDKPRRGFWLGICILGVLWFVADVFILASQGG